MIFFLIIFSVFSSQASSIRDPFHYPTIKNSAPHIIAIGKCNGALQALCVIQDSYLSVEVGTKLNDQWQVQEIGDDFVIFINLLTTYSFKSDLQK